MKKNKNLAVKGTACILSAVMFLGSGFPQPRQVPIHKRMKMYM